LGAPHTAFATFANEILCSTPYLHARSEIIFKVTLWLGAICNVAIVAFLWSERAKECSAAAVKLPAELHRYWTILHYRAHLMSAHKSLLAEQVSV